MSTTSDLRQTRSEVQQRRAELERRERTAVDIRMVYSTLTERSERLARGADPVRSIERLTTHLERLLRRHRDGDRPLHYLGRYLAGISIEEYAEAAATELDLPEGAEVDPETLARFSEDGFADTVLGFLLGLVTGDENSPTATAVSVAYEDLLENGDVRSHLQGQLAAGIMVDLAQVAVYGRSHEGRPSIGLDTSTARPIWELVEGDHTGSLSPSVDEFIDLEELFDREPNVTGTRSQLAESIADHVAALEAADDGLVGEAERDPLAELEWDAPIAMLPVDIETRFVDDELLVRVYPDQIHVDTHEDQLTEAEDDWGRSFWTKLWVAGHRQPGDLQDSDGSLRDPSLFPDDHSREAARSLLDQLDAGEFSDEARTRFGEVRERLWAAGVDRFGDERAAYLVDTLSPQGDTTGARLARSLRSGWSDDEVPVTTTEPFEFPDVDMRPSTWTRTPRAALLPDRFVAFAYYEADDDGDRETAWSAGPRDSLERREGDELVRRVAGDAVREPLATGPSPESVAADGDATAEMGWMTEFDQAERAGMALRIPIPEDLDAERDGFTRLVVRGVKTSMDGPTSVAALRSHLAGTRYTEGLELLGPGTPTNNATDASARSDARDPEASLDSVLGPPLAGPDTDGRAVADALGLDSALFDHVPGAGDTRGADARAVNSVLWPATLGYYARNLLVPHVEGESEDDDEDEDEAEAKGEWLSMLGTGEPDTVEGPSKLLRWLETYREHFVEHVRGGGPLQTLRAGNQPYGLLPVSPLHVTDGDLARLEEPPQVPKESPSGRGFTPSNVPLMDDDQLLPTLGTQVWALRDDWLDWTTGIPAVTDESDMSDERLLSMLSMEATATAYRRQFWLLGADNPLADYAEAPELRTQLEAATRKALDGLGLRGRVPRIADLLFLGATFVSDDLPITDADVGTYIDTVSDLFTADQPDLLLRMLNTDPDADEIALDPDADAGFDRDWLQFFDPTWDTADYDSESTLFRQLLLFGGLHAAIASRVRVDALYGGDPDLPAEPTAYGPGDSSVLLALQDTIPGGSSFTTGDRLTDHPRLGPSSSFRDVVQSTATADERGHPPVDPVLGDYLDSLDHLRGVDPDRLDRLTTETLDLASHRLDAWWTSIATRQLDRLRSVGVQDCYVGAYGVVENLTADSGTTAEYLLAPSLDQVTTASILRSGHQSQPADSPEASALAVDCSAAALEHARPLLAAVRAGLDLPEVLGYRFERGLRERSGGGSGLNLEQYIGDFRALAPGVEGKLGGDDTTDESKQSDVVDGMAVYRRWKQGTLWSDLSVSPGERAKTAIGGAGPDSGPTDSVLGEIHRAMEAIQDLLVAESVHHLSHGRPERAAAALDGLSRAETPPEPTVLDTPRSETGVTNRLVLAFGDATDATVPSAWQPRASVLLSRSDLPGNQSSGVTTAGPIQVRQQGEPNLNAWAGDLLPAPDQVGSTGTFRWERNRGFAIGDFETPTVAGPVSVDVGFEPDLVILRAVTGASATGASETSVTGWSQGVYRRATGDYDAVQQSVAASVANGRVTHDHATNQALRVTFPGPGERIAATVVETTETGFDLDFTTVAPPSDGPETVRVSYRAVSLTDPSSVRVGTYRTPTTVPGSDPSIDLSGAGAPAADAFAPDHVQFATAVTADHSGDGTIDSLAVAEGECLHHADGSLDQQTVAHSVGPAGDEFGVAAGADAALTASTRGSSPTGFDLRVTDFTDNRATVSLSAPQGGTLAGDVPVLFVATESPVVETVGGDIQHQPAIGHVAAPPGDGATRSVQTGFEPGLIEVTVVAGLTDDAQLPVETSVGPEGTVTATGAATSAGVQKSLAIGPTADGPLAASASDGVAVLPVSGSDGPTAGPSVSIDAVSESGFDIGVSGLGGGGDAPLVFYRAWPAEPRTREFAAALPGGVSLDDLDLTPLDAVSITQRVDSSGDSQLERRCGYWAFRHRPTDRQPQRPPVPTDATLDLAFADHADGYAVSVAEYVELASELRELVGEARPANATDVSHPSAGRDPGYLPSNGPIQGTAERLAERAGGTSGDGGIEGQLETVEALLTHRQRVLEPDPNVCDRVATVDDALGRFRRSAPLRSVATVADRIDPTDPDDTTPLTVDQVATAVDQELASVRGHVAAGPLDGGGVALPVAPASDQTITGVADVDGRTKLDVRVFSHADAVRFDRRTTTVTTADDGRFTASFDFSGVESGSAFSVTARPVQQGPGQGGRRGDLLARTFEEPNRDDWAFIDEPPLSKQTSEWTFDSDEGVLRQSSNIYGFEGPPINAPGTIAVTGDLDWTDYRLSVVLSSRDNDAIGVLFRVQDEENYYRFSLDSEREYQRLVKVVDDEPTLLWEDDIGYEVGDRLDVTVVAAGSDLIGYLDGERVFEVTDDDLDRGAVGLYCRANKAAFFHSVRVSSLGRAAEPPVYAADGRVVPEASAADDSLAAAVADQRYLPLLLWLDSVAPNLAPVADSPAGALQTAVDETDWSTVADEQSLMNRTHSLMTAGGVTAETFTVADKRAVRDLLELRDLDLDRLVTAVRDTVGPAAWTGLTELLDITGDPGRPDSQSVWRSNPRSVDVPVEKDREGEVRARLERFHRYPDTRVDPTFAAYSPPLRRLVEDDLLTTADVVVIEEFLSDPSAVIDAFGDVVPGIDELLADLHDLLHHVEALPNNRTVTDLRDDVARLERSVSTAGLSSVVEKLFPGSRYVWDVFEERGDSIEQLVGAYRAGSFPADPLSTYEDAVGSVGQVTRDELSNRVLPAGSHDDLSVSFRKGVLASVRRTLLRASYFGIYGSVPASAAGGSPTDQVTLVQQVDRVRDEIATRLDEAAKYDPTTVDAEPTVEGQQDRLRALLGDEFVVCPPFAPSNTSELRRTLAADLTDDPYATDTWLQRAGTLRDLPFSFQRVRTYSDALTMRTDGDPGLRRTVTPAQLPHVPGQSWLGEDGVTPSGGELALGIEFVTEAAGGPVASDPTGTGPPMAGLLVDEWVERVPDRTEDVGLGLQYDDPSTRPPQSILVATPPQWKAAERDASSAPLDLTWSEGTYWTRSLLEQSLTETMDLIAVRSVDLEAMDGFGHLLPMLCFATNRRTRFDPVETLRDAPSVEFSALDWEVFGDD